MNLGLLSTYLIYLDDPLAACSKYLAHRPEETNKWNIQTKIILDLKTMTTEYIMYGP